jgi:hypothetical protein
MAPHPTEQGFSTTVPTAIQAPGAVHLIAKRFSGPVPVGVCGTMGASKVVHVRFVNVKRTAWFLPVVLDSTPPMATQESLVAQEMPLRDAPGSAGTAGKGAGTA